jgi:hypothetical protein
MRGLFTVGFRAPSRSGANRWTSDIWRAGNSTEPTEIADPIALSFPIIHAVSKLREPFDSKLPNHLHRRFARSSG